MLQTGELIRDLSVRELIAMMASLYPAPLPVAQTVAIAGLDEVKDRERVSVRQRLGKVMLAVGIVHQRPASRQQRQATSGGTPLHPRSCRPGRSRCTDTDGPRPDGSSSPPGPRLSQRSPSWPTGATPHASDRERTGDHTDASQSRLKDRHRMNSSLHMQLARALIADRLRDAEEHHQTVRARQVTARRPRRRPGMLMHGRASFQRSETSPGSQQPAPKQTTDSHEREPLSHGNRHVFRRDHDRL
jgi:hypothetical protein